MTSRPFTILCIFISSISAFPAPQSQVLQSLQPAIPQCAAPCVQTFLEEGFPIDCTSSSSADCLCSQYSRSGFTLGEGILSCLLSYCPGRTRAGSGPFYNICRSRSNAVLPTHSTLFLTTISTDHTPSNTGSATSQPSVTSARNPPNTTSPTGSRRGGPTHTEPPSGPLKTAASRHGPSPTSSNVRPSTPLSSTESPTSSESENSSSKPSALSTVQIVGVAVASVAVLIFAICGFILCSYCRRVRKMRAGNQAASANEPTLFAKPSTSSGRSTVPSHPRDEKRRSIIGFVAPAQPNQIQTNWNASQLSLNQIGVAISPEKDGRVSPTNFKASRPMSRLLPDKPLPRQPAKCFTAPPVHGAIPISTGYGAPIRKKEVPQPAQSYGGGPRGRPRFAPYMHESNYAQWQENIRTAPMNSRPPLNHSQQASPMSSVYLPMQGARYEYGPRESEGDDYLPQYYTIANHSSSSVKASATTENDNRQSVRDSFASMTSFESIDVQDPTPESEEDKQLSPVAESPLSTLRYPKVPRPTNQAVPRSPPIQTRESMSPRRKSEYAAQEVERVLWSMGSKPPPHPGARTALYDTSSSECTASSETIPTKRGLGIASTSAGASRSPNRPPPPDQHRAESYFDRTKPGMKQPPKSPWQLTPHRRGSELFLTVS